MSMTSSQTGVFVTNDNPQERLLMTQIIANALTNNGFDNVETITTNLDAVPKDDDETILDVISRRNPAFFKHPITVWATPDPDYMARAALDSCELGKFPRDGKLPPQPAFAKVTDNRNINDRSIDMLGEMTRNIYRSNDQAETLIGTYGGDSDGKQTLGRTKRALEDMLSMTNGVISKVKLELNLGLSPDLRKNYENLIVKDPEPQLRGSVDKGRIVIMSTDDSPGGQERARRELNVIRAKFPEGKFAFGETLAVTDEIIENTIQSMKRPGNQYEEFDDRAFVRSARDFVDNDASVAETAQEESLDSKVKTFEKNLKKITEELNG